MILALARAVERLDDWLHTHGLAERLVPRRIRGAICEAAEVLYFSSRPIDWTWQSSLARFLAARLK